MLQILEKEMDPDTGATKESLPLGELEEDTLACP